MGRRVSKRRIAFLIAAALVLVALAHPEAGAGDLGTDLFENTAPADTTDEGGEDLIDYPLSHYELDQHVEASDEEEILGVGTGIETPIFSAIPALIAHFLAGMIWQLTALLIRGVTELFSWAFSLDLLNGSPETAGEGALEPIGDAVTYLYENVFGHEWMIVAIILAGGWGVYKALVQRRYTETAGALAKSVVFVLIALFFVYQPERTVGTASEWTNEMSLAFLAGVNQGDVDDPEQAKEDVRNELWRTFAYDPWRVLNFGGLEVGANENDADDEGFPAAVSCDDPEATVCHDTNEYALLYLPLEPGSEERDAVYEALRDGEKPSVADTNTAPSISDASGDVDRSVFGDSEFDKSDAVAVDIQQEGGALQRLVYSALVFVGALGVAILVGFLSLAVILAQVIALVFLAFAPIALVVGIFPGRGHDFFAGWLSKLGIAIVIKAAYSLLLAVVMAVSSALLAATGELGFLFVFGIQTLFFWAVFIYRKTLANRPLEALTGGGDERERRHEHGERGARAVGRTVGRAVRSPVESFRRPGVGHAALAGAAGGATGAVAAGGLSGAAKRSLRERGAGRRIAHDAERTLKRRQRFLQAKPEKLRSTGERQELRRLQDTRPEKATERKRRLDYGKDRARESLTGRPYSRRELREQRRDIAEDIRARSGAPARGGDRGQPEDAGRQGPTVPRSELSPRERLEQIDRQVEEIRRSRPSPPPAAPEAEPGREPKSRRLPRIPRPRKDG